MAGGRILSVSITNEADLYKAYMPFLINGGLFIKTTKQYSIGDELFLRLSLMNETDKIPVPGRVVWITPSGSQGNRSIGIGVQFTEADDPVVSKIENYLVGWVASDRFTHTM